jgi:hypothetical protein
MRLIILPFALTGLVATAPGCDVEDPLGELGGTDTSTTGGTDTSTGGTDTSTGGTDTVTPAEPEFFAVIVDDSAIFPTHRSDGGNPCATSSAKAHGADLDAVELRDDTGASLGYLDSVRLALGTVCDNDSRFEPIADEYRVADEVKGAPDGKLTENFVSLGGGYVIGEFAGAPLILPGYTIVVYEVGSDEGGQDEGFELFVAEDLSCGQSGGDRTACQVRIGEGDGRSTFTDLSGF